MFWIECRLNFESLNLCTDMPFKNPSNNRESIVINVMLIAFFENRCNFGFFQVIGIYSIGNTNIKYSC